MIHNNSLYKSFKFDNYKYIGDPINAVKIFNEKKVDELIIVDIDANNSKNLINFNLIKKIANECNMPLCYGGGIENIDQIEKIISLGVEKISISSCAISNPQLLFAASKKVGKQSVVLTLDVKKNNYKYDIFIKNGKIFSGYELKDFLKKIDSFALGELLINSIDRDGTKVGYDIDLINYISDSINVPLTISGGAGSIDHFKEVALLNKNIGLAASSFFVFKGKFNAVLLSYLSQDEKKTI